MIIGRYDYEELAAKATSTAAPECCSYDVEYIMDGEDVDEVVYTF